jgi:hypothetical protein
VRYTLAIAALVVALAGCASSDLPARDDWLVMERSNTEDPEIVLVRLNFPSASVRSKYPNLLRVEWGYASLPNGMPTAEEIERGKALYSALEEIVGTDGVHAMTRTGDGGRTIYYYVKDPMQHSEKLRRYFDSLPPISVRIVGRHEPGWDSVRTVLDARR